MSDAALLDRITAADNLRGALSAAAGRCYLREEATRLVTSGASTSWLADLKGDLTTGKYSPTVPVLRTLSHADDSSRTFTCEVLGLRDWVTQRAILVPLRDSYRQRRASESSGGAGPLVKGRRELIVRAKRAIANGLRWFAYADVRNFFGAIDVDRLIHEMCTDTGQPAVAELVRRCLGRRRGLPSGHVLSPFLSNVYLLPLDRRPSLAPWFRYADDMFLHRTTRVEAEAALGELDVALRERGLEMHPRKRLLVDLPDPTRLLELRLL